MFLLTLHDVYPFDGALNGDCSVSHIDVAPLQSTYFANAQSCAQADVDTEAHEGEVVLHIVQYLSVIGHSEDFKFLGLAVSRIFDIPLIMVHLLVLYPKLHHHLHDDENVLDRFHTQSMLDLFQDECLNFMLMERIVVTKLRKNMVLQDQHVGSHSGLLHIGTLVLFPSLRNFSNCFLVHTSFKND